jgi:D-tyrosyl-tRNA(Tyr) deacylase
VGKDVLLKANIGQRVGIGVRNERLYRASVTLSGGVTAWRRIIGGKWIGDIVIGLLQRVMEARVDIDADCVATIGAGLVVLVGVRPDDDEASALRLVDRLLQYRVFADENGKMNLSLGETQGDLLLVPQFTLAADTHKGLRPGFSTAAPPGQGRRLFDTLVQGARARHGRVETGVFGAHMRVTLTNDGPVTFWLES